ncbi:MAG: 23S rRNA (guanosine(2251)-2'-O)-methyltransferase RlmB [Bacilli bacterium]|nr:23S rRNA (guanosine(2251)-2'-O)-methyltransferase RlmB [Bacilli bacterium]
MADYYVYGRNAVRECLHSGSAKILYVRERFNKDALTLEAKQQAIEIVLKSDAELDRLAESKRHQGFVCLARAPEMVSLRLLIQNGKAKDNPLILILDGIEDPVNLGAILRSADAFGVDGVIIKNTGGVSLNSTVAKVSTGAVAYVPVCGVPNLSQAISELKDAGYWVVSSDGSATMGYDQVDYKGPMVLVVGSEGFGISRLVLQRSDFIVKIPMVGHVNSLNASVATGILLSHIALARNK